MQDFSALLLNLDRDTARLVHMQDQLKRAGMAFTRQPGILGDAVPNDLRPYFFEPDGTPKTGLKRGELGCYASHLRALLRTANGEYGGKVLIMEDDLNIEPHFLAIVSEACRLMPQGWDILRLSSAPRRAYAPLASLGQGRLLVRYSKIPTSAGAYLVTRAGAKKFVEQGVRGLSFDDDLRRPWFHHMETYGIVPPPAKADAFAQSTIDSAEAGRFDKGMSSNRERLKRGDQYQILNRMTYNMRDLGMVGWLSCQAINIADMVARPLMGRSIIHDAARLFPLRWRKHA